MPQRDKMYIAVDFDGTVVTHEFPRIGKDIGAFPHLRRWVKLGAQIILFTMRSGEYLDAAVALFEKEDVPLLGVNVNPHQHSWTTSPKAYAHLYIDDAALGIPLVNPADGSRPYVAWHEVGPAVEAMLRKRG